MSKQECAHGYCPHQHYKKCLKERYRNIAYTIFPVKNLDSQGNAHIKCVNPKMRNIETAAYSKFYEDGGVDKEAEESNFVKDYYLENASENATLINKVVKHYEDSIWPDNAYNLAEGATKEYYIFENKRKSYLKNARMRAKHNYNNFFETKRQQQAKQIENDLKWIKNLYRMLEELVDHMFNQKNTSSQNEDPNIKDKMFLRQHQGQTSKTLSELKVRDPQAAIAIIESVKAQLLRKKGCFEEQRKDQEHNVSASVSNIDASSQSINTSQASFISTATNEASEAMNESKIAEKYCNFEELKLKWKVRDVNEVKEIITRLLSKKVVSDGEGAHIRKVKQAEKNNQTIRKQSNSLKKQETKLDSKKKIKQRKEPKIVPCYTEKLPKGDLQTKESLIKGGQFDSFGDTYLRNRNYSQMFKKRQQKSCLGFQMKDQDQLKNSSKFVSGTQSKVNSQKFQSSRSIAKSINLSTR